MGERQTWRGLLDDFRRFFSRQSGIHLNADLLDALRLMAKRDGRSEHDLTVDLIASGYAQQQVSWELMRCWRMLTPREREVVVLICCNYTNRQIADHLVVSIETVRSHVRHSLRKFGVQNRRELCLLLAGWKFSDRFLASEDR
jgi:DNA-binding CsgD family transcriptional regulator